MLYFRYYVACFLLISLSGNTSIFGQPTMGLIINEPESSEGYTLFGVNETTYLIDHCGWIVNTWLSDTKPGKSMYLLENGNLLRTAQVDGHFSGGGLGGRFELFNWDGQLLWQYDIADKLNHAHHDIAPISDTRFLAIIWDKISAKEAQDADRIDPSEIWSELIIELEILPGHQAKIVWQWRLWDHLIQDIDQLKKNYGIISDHPEKININYRNLQNETNPYDWIHLNSIDYNPHLDQILVSSRNFNEVWIIDHSTTVQEARTSQGGRSGRGGDILYRYGNPETYNISSEIGVKFNSQHGARWINIDLPYENYIAVFNNKYLPNQSSIEIWKPSWDDSSENYIRLPNNSFGPTSVAKRFIHDELYSDIMSSVQITDKGNLLICEGRTGHFIEFTPEGSQVWKYINPVNRNAGPGIQGGSPRFNETFSIMRYPIDYSAFHNKAISAKTPIELRPKESDCHSINNTNSYDSITSNIVITYESGLNSIVIKSENTTIPLGNIYLFELNGRLLKSIESNFNTAIMDIEFLNNGSYVILVTNKMKRVAQIFTLAK